MADLLPTLWPEYGPFTRLEKLSKVKVINTKVWKTQGMKTQETPWRSILAAAPLPGFGREQLIDGV